ncbi:MAG: TCR/Tet family MFS transporter [Pseudomonadota bacterium]
MALNLPQPNRTPGKNAFAFIFVTVLIGMTGFGIIVPVMPDLIMEVSGQDRAFAAQWGGILSASYAVMQFIFSPVLGALSDRFGRRPVLLGSLAMYSLDFLLLALAPSLSVLLAARLLAGTFAATFTTANAYIADISPPEKRAANFGAMGAAFGLGFIVGPLLGGVVGDAYGARAPFFLVAALGALNLLYGAIVLPETLKPENRRPFEWKRANALGSFRRFQQYPAILPIALAVFVFQLGHWALPSVWAYFAGERFDWSAREIAYSLAFVGLSAAIVQGGLTRIVIPKIGETASAFFGLTVAACVMPVYAIATEAWMVYAAIPIGALVGFVLPALQGIMSRTLPANAQGELQGALSSVNGLSMILGPFIMTQTFAAFAAPGTPVTLGPLVLSETGAPFYFPGAPFVLASVLVITSAVILAAAAPRIARNASGDADAPAEETLDAGASSPAE